MWPSDEEFEQLTFSTYANGSFEEIVCVADGTEIEISAALTDDVITIAVADRGPGIKEEHKRKIFEKFYREEPNNASGVGLGLAICNGIVEAHGGKIWVENRPGGGAIFKFTVPISNNLSDFSLDEELTDQIQQV